MIGKGWHGNGFELSPAIRGLGASYDPEQGDVNYLRHPWLGASYDPEQGDVNCLRPSVGWDREQSVNNPGQLTSVSA